MPLIGSILKMLMALGALCIAIYLGLQLDPEKEIAERTPFIFGVALSTFSPIGLFLYVKYWEPKPDFSSACGKQAMIGIVYLVGHALITHFFPTAIDHWTK
jgi:hypothetical protein